MKLIDILVDAGDETPLFGVHTKYLAMDPDGRVHGYCDMPSPTALGWGVPDALYSTDGRGCLIQIDRDDVDGQWQSAIITREQYEAALAAKNEGWIVWGGGECPPVSTNTVVDVKFKNGNVQSGYPAGEYSWEHAWQSSNIIAYRLHQLKEVEQTEAEQESALNECIGQDTAPVWNGEGLPPVGCECEFISNDTSWGSVVVIGMDGDKVVIKPSGETYYGITPSEKQVFRPIRSEAEQKRNMVISQMMNFSAVLSETTAGLIYDAIADGNIRGIRLED